jgi:predicted nucleic acid-binding Zn ribbon protein
MVKASTAISSDEQIAAIVADLQRRGASKPRTVQTLTSTISALFQKKLSEPEVAALIQALQKQKIVQIQETKVSYTLPG